MARRSTGLVKQSRLPRLQAESPIRNGMRRLCQLCQPDAKDNTQILHWGKEMIKVDPRPETYHDALFQYQRIADLDNLESLSLLRLARLNKALMFEHEFKQYVEYADARRYPAEVAAVLDEGFAKGTISKSNLTFSEIYSSAQKLIPELSGTWDRKTKRPLWPRPRVIRPC
jgi:hypothetical protein